jgi:hypothetical protein
MTFGLVGCLKLFVFLSLGLRVAYAGECPVSGPRYQLRSDTVEWRMQISSGESCLSSIRYYNVAFASMNLIAPPLIGQVTLLGPAFSYTAKSDFQGADSFTLGVSGASNRISGTSTIRIAVSVVGAPEAPSRTPPASRDRPPAPAPALQSPRTPAVDNTPPLAAGAALPPCPTWDWSSGSPPPMRSAFDRSKLYCPPPPFNPPGPPVDCICPR